MDKFTNEVDDEFFENLEKHNVQKTNLYQLFDDDMGDKEVTLKYQPEKTPAKETAGRIAKVKDAAEQSWSTVLAKVANGYNGAQLVGKLGAALLVQSPAADDDDDNMHNAAVKLILYRSKTSVLSTATLRERLTGCTACKIQHQEAYLQFYDDEQRYWSLRFDSDNDELDFIKKLKELSIALEDIKLPYVTPKPDLFANCVDDGSADELKDTSLSGQSSAKPITTTKSRLLSRISKVGQALPNLTCSELATSIDGQREQLTSGSTESDIDVIVTPAAMPRKSKSRVTTTTAAAAVGGPIPAVAALTSAEFGYKTMEHHLMQLLCTEHRTEKSELRLNISKLDYKLDKVLDKLEKLDTSDVTRPTVQRDEELLALEEKLLAQKKENHRLKQVVASPSDNAQLLVNYRRQLQQLELPSTTDDDSFDMANTFDELVSKALKLQVQAVQPCSNCVTLSQQLSTASLKERQKVEAELDALRGKVSELVEVNTNLRVDLATHVHTHKQALEAQEQRLQDEADVRVSTATADQMKLIMNKLYSTLVAQLSEEDHKLVALIGQTIKHVTLQGIEASESSTKQSKT